MNTSQPQDSLRKKFKKLTKTEKKLKKNEAGMGTRLLPLPPPRPWEAKHSAPSIQKLLHGPWETVTFVTPRASLLLNGAKRSRV